MSSTLRVVLALVVVATVAACGRKAEPVTYVDESVTVEPTYTGKYK